MARLGMAGFAAAAAAVAPALPASAGTSTPNDTYFVQGDQWGLTGYPASTHAPQAWPVSTGSGILIADVDTGADFNHPDLAGKLIAGARCLGGSGTCSSGSVQDDYGHGSLTTGIMVANTNNGKGIAAVAPDARALIVKVLDHTGSGFDNDVAAGIQYAADSGARVINLSIGADVPGLGLSTFSQIPAAVQYAAGKGVAVALAAGNNGLPVSDYAEVDNVALVVGALGPDGSTAYYSNNLAGVNIYAPGGDSNQTSAGNNAKGQVVSTYFDDGYRAEQGTSFAAPHAAGTLALLMSCGLNSAQARQRILDTAHNGQLDAAAAVSGQGHCGATAAPPPPPPKGSGGGGSSGSGTGGNSGAGSGSGSGSSSSSTGHSGGGAPVSGTGTGAGGGAAHGVGGAAQGAAAPGSDPATSGATAAAGSADAASDRSPASTVAGTPRTPQQAVAIAGVTGGLVTTGILLQQLVVRRLRRPQRSPL